MSLIRRLLLPVITIALGVAMLTIPWLLPMEHGRGKAVVFAVAGSVELLLGVALAYVTLHAPSAEAEPPHSRRAPATTNSHERLIGGSRDSGTVKSPWTDRGRR